MALRYDPEFLAWRTAVNPPPRPPINDPLEFRALANKAFSHIFADVPLPAEVERSDHTVTSADGAEIEVIRLATGAHRSATATSLQPAVVFVFGGGLMAGSADNWVPWVAQDVADTGVQFFVADYRLAPEHKAPAGAEDIYAAVAWLSAEGASLGVDPARIAIAGVSAGGCHAAGATLLARDRKLSPPVAKQVLIYPMLDDRTGTRLAAADDAVNHPLGKLLAWTPRSNRMGWTAYLGADKAGIPEAEVSPYGAPGRVEDLAGLPSTYVDVGGLDLFREENIEFVAKLARAYVEVEFHIYPGVPHGFEPAADISVAKSAKANRIKAYRSF